MTAATKNVTIVMLDEVTRGMVEEMLELSEWTESVDLEIFAVDYRKDFLNKKSSSLWVHFKAEVSHYSGKRASINVGSIPFSDLDEYNAYVIHITIVLKELLEGTNLSSSTRLITIQ